MCAIILYQRKADFTLSSSYKAHTLCSFTLSLHTFPVLPSLYLHRHRLGYLSVYLTGITYCHNCMWSFPALCLMYRSPYTQPSCSSFTAALPSLALVICRRLPSPHHLVCHIGKMPTEQVCSIKTWSSASTTICFHGPTNSRSNQSAMNYPTQG
jgi:hypothetical protein